MNTKEWAEKLNNIEYPCDNISKYRNQLSEDGVVVVYGASDDLMELDGAIYDEYDCYSSKTFYWFGKWFVSNDHIEDFIESVRYDDYRVFADIVEDAFKDIDNKKSYIKVNTETSNAQFEYETNIPNVEWFNVMGDGELYCKGFVFNKNDLKM